MRIARVRTAPEMPPEQGRRNAAFYLFCAFLCSYFLRIPARVPLLGAAHLDIVLALITAVAIVLAARRETGPAAPLGPVATRLWILLAYIVVTIPFTEWPGSALRNFEPFAKSVCFFFFVVATVDTVRKLRTIFAVFIMTQLVRVFEPLYLHMANGYWGSLTSLGNWETMDRLSGSPYDTINPNGLGFVIIVTLSMLHLLIRPDTAVRRLIWLAVAGSMCYALVLSASRSAFLGLMFLCLFAIWRSKRRAALLAAAALAATLALSLMTGLQRDRYLSIFSHDAPGAATAEGRITSVVEDFEVSMRRPLFGHGLGTSREANANYRGADLLSHNLYTEVAEELGYVGLALFLALIWSFLVACWATQRAVKAVPATDERLRYLHTVAVTLVTVIAVDLFFSFAAYGLSEPYWYFIGGLAVATGRVADALARGPGESGTLEAQPRFGKTLGDRVRKRRPRINHPTHTPHHQQTVPACHVGELLGPSDTLGSTT